MTQTELFCECSLIPEKKRNGWVEDRISRKGIEKIEWELYGGQLKKEVEFPRVI